MQRNKISDCQSAIRQRETPPYPHSFKQQFCTPVINQPIDPLVLNRLISINEVMGLLAIKSKATIYEMVRNSGLPAPKRIGPRCSRWVLAEVLNYINTQPRAEISETKEAA